MSSKTVVLMVKRVEDGETRIFPESAEVGLDNHYSTASDFINECKRMYAESSRPGDRFEIINVVIG